MLESIQIFPKMMTGMFWSEQFQIRLFKDFTDVNNTRNNCFSLASEIIVL